MVARGVSFLVIALALAVSLSAAEAERTVTLAAKAVLLDGTAAAGVAVEFLGYRDRSTAMQVDSRWRGKTDANGEVRFQVRPADIESVECHVLPEAGAKVAPCLIQMPEDTWAAYHKGLDVLVVLAPASCALKGTITDADGKPAAGAVVTLTMGNQRTYTRTAATDTLGQYSIDGLATGTYIVRKVEAPAGSPWTSLEEWRGLQHINLKTGQAVQADFQLPRGARITGRVLDEQGKPVADAEVHCRTDQASEIGDQSKPGSKKWYGGSAKTNADGRYHLNAMSPETYWIDIKPPAASGLATASLRGITLHDADLAVQDVNLTLSGTLSGVVLAEGKPQAGRGVTLHIPDYDRFGRGERNLFVLTDKDGAYSFKGLPTGTFKLSADAPDNSPWMPTEIRAAAVRGFGTVANIELRAGMTVTGVVTDPDGKPAPHADVSVEQDEKYGSSVSFRGKADAAGKFRIQGVHVPQYHNPGVGWRVRAVPGSAVGALRHGDTLIEKPVPGKTIEAVVKLTRGVCFTGVVKGPDGKPLAGCRIAAVQRTRGGYSAFSDSDLTTAEGRFAFWGLDPNSYAVTIYPPSGSGLLPWSGEQKNYTVGEHPIEATLKKGATVTGRVTTKTQQILAYASVRMEQIEGAEVDGYRDYGLEQRSGPKGTFRFAGMLPGKYKLVCTPIDPSHGQKEIQVTVPAEGEVAADVVF